MDNVIHLVDNNKIGTIIQQESVADILKLSQMGCLKDNPDLLVFPYSFSELDDGIGELSILTTGEFVTDNTGIVSLKAYTGNMMGFVGVNQTSVSIHSRFIHRNQDGAVDDAIPDYFLYYMLQRILSINVFNLDHSISQDDKVFDFLLFLFPFMLKKALSQGLYKEYRNFQYNDSHVKGVIDINRFIHNNIPFNGKVSYHAREHSYDNDITQLIRHTIEYIRTHPIGSSLLSADRDMMEAVSQIRAATPSYSSRAREKIINANLKPKVHPYFLKYRDLQQLCVRILRHESLKYGSQKDTIHGILFDGAWLWEEYLNTILKDLGFSHPKNKVGEGGIRMFAKPEDEEHFDRNSRKMYPDFYRKDYIIDAKYKHLNGNFGREDLYQVVSYMYCMNTPFGGYIYPDDSNQEIRLYKLNGIGQTFTPIESGGILSVIPFPIPQKPQDWTTFQQDMKKSKEVLSKYISKIQFSL